jgi:Fe-Mn family superoxide dismutase
MNYTEKKFDIPALDGISAKSIEEHLGLYAGYVKNFNAISEKMVELSREDMTKNVLPLNELIRRRSFEFDGMRLHEYYFAQFEGGATVLNEGSALAQQFAREYHKSEYLVEFIKAIGAMRGPGWAVLYWDPEVKQFVTSFVGEQHQGHLVGLPVILALDVWEHAYLLDHGAAGKAKYIDAFFKNLNWSVCESRFEALQK